MRLITGDECGILKESIPELARQESISKDKGIQRFDTISTPSRRHGVVALSWLSTRFASLRRDGVVEVWERSVDELQDFAKYRVMKNLSCNFEGATRPIAMEAIDSQSLCACDDSGSIMVIDPFLEENPIRQKFSTFIVPENDSKLYPTVSAMAVDTSSRRVALGGKDREVVLWDLENAQQVWKTKNLPPDPQTLLQPQVWPTSILMLSEGSIGNVAVGSAHCDVRIYDIRQDSTQRRPIMFTPNGFLEYRVTAMCQLDPYHLVVGDSAGTITTIDLRLLGKQAKAPAVAAQGRFVGPVGSVRQLVKHPSINRMAAVGLDRMLRIYDTKTRKQVSCMYLKQRVNCVLFGPDGTWGEDGEDLDNQDIDQDDIVRDYVASDEESGEDDDSARLNEPASGSDQEGILDDESSVEDEEEANPRKRRKQ